MCASTGSRYARAHGKKPTAEAGEGHEVLGHLVGVAAAAGACQHVLPYGRMGDIRGDIRSDSMASGAKRRQRETDLGSVVCRAEFVADDVGPHVGGAQRGAAVHAVVGLRDAVRETLPVLPETS